MTPGPIDRDPNPRPTRRREPRWLTATLRPVAFVAGAIFLAMILIRGHA